ncbi:hypothetical protein A1O3_02481 [Capronia epimyces CBS 606.96]|uniref:Uncharacterized protein n=1 Tax=Capronia epimyces CBS 606.96 TaxID=1182542 RepID=W9Z4K2_9EURO|nr:uncharacterized protein A1O3_02481 [Capronia epimyces CBS 606.96]EXJ89414.1 hypothetical protein A1O3_02481 [Capronia epimyces CBS 606.96]
MAPPTRAGLYDTCGCVEGIELERNENETIPEEHHCRKKSFLRKLRLSTGRKRDVAADDSPPFIMREIPYELWRKHYAKDQDGKYRGTHAPAEDCLLKPDDVQKWRLGDPVTKADKWTRGGEVLPVYAEVCADGLVPEYEVTRHGQERTSPIDSTITMASERLTSPTCGRTQIIAADT